MNKFFIFILFFSFLFLCSCYGETDNLTVNSAESVSEPAITENELNTGYKKITAEEAFAMMEETESFILLDVRTDGEFNEQRIDGARLIPDYEISERAYAELTDTAALILVYCRSGRRSKEAADELIRLGYTNVYDFGGIIDWSYETVGGE